MTQLQGRVALVTGSSRCTGAAIARRFAAEGAAVAVHGRNYEAAGAVLEQITTARGKAISVIADLTDFTQIDANLTTTFFTIKAFLPGMNDRHRGIIIATSSAAARHPTAGSSIAYAAAKAGIELLTKEVAL